MTATAPVQTRSKQTLAAILAAAEELLKNREFDSITIADIVSEAGCTTGSFYARFDSKEALLPMLYARYEEALPDFFEGLSVHNGDMHPSLLTMLETAIAAIVRVFDDRPRLMRAIVLYARSEPMLADSIDQRRTLIARIIERFEPFHDEIARADPGRAVEIALFVAISTLRDRILFPHAPNAAALAADRETLIAEVTAMVAVYLKTDEGQLT